MRNQFSELIKQGVARFQSQPIANETPCNDELVRLYNAYWGMATDSHMTLTPDGTYVITGRIVQDPVKWTTLLTGAFWGGVRWSDSGFYSLSELFGKLNYQLQVSSHNGEPCLILVKCPDDKCEFECPKSYTTTESKIPHPIGELGPIGEMIEHSNDAKDLINNLNNSKTIFGDRWYIYENNLMCSTNNATYILENVCKNGQCIDCPDLKKNLEKEGLGDIKLVKVGNHFRIDSDDPKWQRLLKNWKNNKINVKSYDDMTPEEWVDHIKWMVSELN